MDENEGQNKISVDIIHNLVNKSLELFDCSPQKSVKPERTLQTGKSKISKVTFGKAVAVALGPALGQSTHCLNCC